MFPSFEPRMNPWPETSVAFASVTVANAASHASKDFFNTAMTSSPEVAVDGGSRSNAAPLITAQIPVWTCATWVKSYA